MEAQNSGGQGLIPVSYTHLDVYKRQGYSKGGGICILTVIMHLYYLSMK